MSDGEWQEGTVWEAAMVAGQHKLDNLTFITDYNKWTAMGRTKDVADIEPAEEKWQAFNWQTAQVDGHDYNRIEFSIQAVQQSTIKKPKMIIAHTVKGKGVSFFEDHLLYHYKYVDDQEFSNAVKELT